MEIRVYQRKSTRCKFTCLGASRVASVVNYCMRKTADDNELTYSELAIDTLRRSFYMDDMIRSVKSVEEATRALFRRWRKLLEEGGFSLGKFMSTSRRRD